MQASGTDLFNTNNNNNIDTIKIPVYLNEERQSLLFCMEAKLAKGEDPSYYYQRAIAFTAS